MTVLDRLAIKEEGILLQPSPLNMLDVSGSTPEKASPPRTMSTLGKRTGSRSSLVRRVSRPPSLNTVYEYRADGAVDAVPAQEEAMLEQAEEGEQPMRGRLALRAGPSWLPARLLGRRAWASRYAVLQPAVAGACGGGGAPPRLLLFLSDDMEALHEELLLIAPLQLQCLPFDGHAGHMRFTLSTADAPPIELAVQSEELRQQWVLALGESMQTPCPTPPRLPRSPLSLLASALSPPASPVGLPSPGGKVQLVSCKVSDNYRMGKLLSQGENDVLVVEGVHLRTQQSHALKLVSKDSKRMRRVGSDGVRLGSDAIRSRACSRLLGQCLEEVYEGPNHVCIVLRWGTHELDADHQLAVAVLEALRLLRELVPEAELPPDGMMLPKADTQRLMLRAVALDCHLQSNLFI